MKITFQKTVCWSAEIAPRLKSRAAVPGHNALDSQGRSDRSRQPAGGGLLDAGLDFRGQSSNFSQLLTGGSLFAFVLRFVFRTRLR
jgi:hypothetical protein